jgi:hypothetical protein
VIGTPPATRPRRRLLGVAFVVVLCLATALAGAAVPALAAKPKHHRGPGPKAVILAPKREARTAGTTLTVRVRASTKVNFQASVAGTDVTRRFHRRGGLFEATLRRGRDYQLGENVLAVSVGKGRRLPTTVAFVSLKQARGLLKVTKRAAHGARPLRFEIHATAPLAGMKVTVDGRRYPIGEPGSRRNWTVAIGASDGAHFGANTIVVAAERQDSTRFDREKVHFQIGRGAPLAGAGADETTRTGRAVTLHGGSTMAGSRHGSLLYRWKIVQKPHGSHARIANGTSPKASLLPDLPGSYKVRLVAARVSGKVAAEEKEAGKTATASSTETAAQPTCLEWASTPLIPAGSSSGGSTSGGSASAGAAEPVTPLTPAEGGGESESETSSGPFDPLEAPVCVTPIGELTPPPLPPEAALSLSADEVEVQASPTESPMGWSVETLADDGSIRVGPQTFAKENGWVHMVVLNQGSLIPVQPVGAWKTSNKVFQLSEAAQFQYDVEHTTEEEVVILSGMGLAQQTPPVGAEEALGKALSSLGVPSGENQNLEAAVESGRWSAIGTHAQPGRTYTNVHGLGEQTIEGMPPTLAGSLNGWMQSVLTNGYAYVSPEAIPFDTKAEGSSANVNVIEVGGEKATSGTIPNGTLALHIAVFNVENTGGKPTVAANYTDVINGSNNNPPGVEAAAKQLEEWRLKPENVLILMQTVGEETVGPNTRPWASKYWVDDALIPPNQRGLLEWDKQAYLGAKNEAELEDKQAERWNPGFPTVAGQVGELTSEAGHDLVGIFGGGNPTAEVTRLTMVAENHPETTESNYVNGYAAPSPGRLDGILVRNARGGLQVENASALPLTTTNTFREVAFAPATTPWPDSEGKENEAALKFFAERIWPTEDFKTPREAYVKKVNNDWDQIEAKLQKVKYVAAEGFELKTFTAVKQQLETEMNDMAAVTKAMSIWRELFGEEKIAAYVNAQSIGAKLIEQIEKEAKKKPKAEAEIDPEEVISEALYITSDLAGFPETTEFLKLPEIISMVSSGMGLANAVTPESPEEAEGPNSSLIRANATNLGTTLFKHFEGASKSLEHFEGIFASNWGKLKKAGEYSDDEWSFETEVKELLGQSLAVATEQQLYEGLLPMAYTQWVISPYFTKYMTSGPQTPGQNYKCIHFHTVTETPTVYPFKDAAEGSLSTNIYRPWDPPGSNESPSQQFTVPFTIRSLKSDEDPPEVIKSEYSETEDLIEIHHGGANAPASLVNPLFAPINKGEAEPNFPKSLGINKTAFYANFGGGPNEWKRIICAQG